ncbi:MAG: hypothetical protein ABSC05_26420 [Candidatus Solibacter sp.]
MLREFRTRLVADVVTGKLDVRSIELPTIGEAPLIGDLVELEEIEDSGPDESEVVEENTNAND